MPSVGDLLKVVLPRKRGAKNGVADTPTYNRSSPDTPLSTPTDRDHLKNLIDTRLNNSGAAIMLELFRNDPDVSAAVNSFLTAADTEPRWVCRDVAGNVDRAGQEMVEQVLQGIFTRFDYVKPAAFALKPTMRAMFEDMRYFVLLRGALMPELVMNERLLPDSIRLVDPVNIEWIEKKSGVPIPEQVVSGDRVSLDVPTFFVSFFRKSPTTLYSHSPFISAINTIAARQQVINDLYRIMRKTGYPRISASLMEEVLRKNAPADAKADEALMRQYLGARRDELAGILTNMQAEEALVTFDSMTVGILNEKNPAAQLDITNVIKVLNESNQAALKTMSTIIGRGETGVNTASVEARIFSMNAEQINRPLEDVMSKMLTLAIRLQGSQSRVEFSFAKVELRPDLELEPQRTMRQARLLEQLSLGLITDDEFHIQMYGRIRPNEVQELSGTNFMNQNNSIDPWEVSPNGDALGRSIAPEGSKQARSDTIRKGQKGSKE